MALDPERLEDILIARSLGTLGPEAEVLLADYLERNPKAAELAEEYREVGSLATKVLASPERAILPPFPGKIISDANRRKDWPPVIIKSLSWAACLAIGFSIGWMVSGVQESPKFESRPIAAGLPETSKETRPVSTVSFWSVRASVRPGREDRARNSYRLIWKSPVEQPSIGG